MRVQLTSSTLSILRISESRCLCCLPNLGLCRRLVRLRLFLGRSFGPWPGIIGLMCGTLEHVRGWKLLCMIFQQFAAKVRWKLHFREEPRGFYIQLKNSRYIPPFQLVTPLELERWLSLLREKMLITARTTLHNPRRQQSRSNVLPLTEHGWKCLKTSCWVAFFERQKMEVSLWCMKITCHKRTWRC